MKLSARMRRGLPATLLVYGCETAAAALIGAPLAAQLAKALARDPLPSPRQAAGLLETVLRAPPPQNGWALSYAAGFALLSPFLSLAWLACMQKDGRLDRALRTARSSYQPALALALGCALAQGAVLALGAASLAYLPGLLPDSEGAQAASRGSLVAAAAATLLGLATLHDLGRAALAAGAAGPRSALRLAWRGLGIDTLLGHGLAVLGTALCLGLAELTGRALAGTSALLFVLVPQQLLVLLATLGRSAWLAYAAERVGSGPAGSAGPISGQTLNSG